MALVEDQRFERALRPGRIRDTATRLLAAVAEDPDHAATRLRAGLREATWLHSAERRLIGDGVYDLLRWTGIIQGTPDERWTRWVRWQAEGDPALDAEIADLARSGAIARLAGVDDDVAAELVRAFGPRTGDFVLASNVRAPVALRALGDRAELAERLAARGIPTRPGALASTCLLVEGRFNLENTPEFREGRFELQDEAGQAAVERAIDGVDGEILDLCAGAGGKSLALAAAGRRVVAADVRPRALGELERRARRAGLRIPTRAIAPGKPLPREWIDRFALVLVDAPCTGTGVWRRHPELRPRAQRFRELARVQADLLALAATAVARGGALAYATCSVLPAEDEDVFESFVRSAGFARSSEHFRWAPHTTGSDGFYTCKAVRP